MKPRTISPTFSKNMLKIAAFACLGGAFGIPAAYAEPLQAVAPEQTGTITGVVVDGEGEPLIGATVLVKGTPNGTATDIDGRFSLKASAGQELQISYVGYQTLVLKILSGKFNLGNVVLTSISQNLDDVVVIGYGTQRKGDVTSAVAQVRAEDFSIGNNNNAGDLIKGKVENMEGISGSRRCNFRVYTSLQ